MIALADINAVWELVFEHQDMLAISESVLDFQYTDESQTEIEALMTMGSDGVGIVNFFEYLVEIRSETVIEMGGAQHPEAEIVVDVRYTKTLDPTGSTEREVKAAIETLRNTVRSELGSAWSALDVRTDPQITIGAVTREEINGALCVRQIATFRAFKQ